MAYEKDETELKGEEKTRVEALVGKMIDEAEDFYVSNLSEVRTTATDYYKARPFGDEEQGRSQVVIPIVRGIVRGLMPTIMRVFTGPERYVEYRSRGKGDDATAKQATDYVNYIITEDNDGFRIIHDLCKDALIRRVGVLKWWAEKVESNEKAKYSGLSQDQMLSLLLDRSVKLTKVSKAEDGTFNATVERVGPTRRIKLAAVPGGEVYWDGDARNFDDARIVVHSRSLPLFELEEMGIDSKLLNEHAGDQKDDEISAELESMRNDNEVGLKTDGAQDDDTRLVRYDEAYVRLKIPSLDKRVRLYKVCTVGDAHKLALTPEPVSHRPFAAFCPDPEAHTLVGLGAYDDGGMIQRIQSKMARGILDSLSLALDPATEIVDGAVNIADLLNPEIGRTVRVTAAGSMREIKHSFAGADALGVMQYFDSVKEDATGQSKAAMGLDADALQSSTKAGVAATLSASQQRIEMICRLFADGFKVAYAGLLRTVVENQDAARTVRLRGEYVEIDPKSWDASMDVVVNVGLGQGTPEERINNLAGIKAAQEQILQTLGPSNPLVKLSHYRNTLARMIELAGFRDADEFFSPIDPQMEQQMEAAAAQQGGQNNPEADLAAAEIKKAEIQAQVQREKIAAETQARQQELSIKAQEAQARLAADKEKLAIDTSLRIMEIEKKYGGQVDREQLKAMIELEKANLSAEAQITVAEINADAQERKLGVDLLKQEISADTSIETTRMAGESAERAARQRGKDKPSGKKR